jgi:tryptophan-rich sensory protein
MNNSRKKNIVENTVNVVMGVKNSPHQASYQPDNQIPELDISALIRYIFGTIVQITLMLGTLWLINLGFEQLYNHNITSGITNSLSCIILTILAIRSRLFSPLDNTRSRSLYDHIQRPSWAPPPLAFPIVWMSIAVLRVISAYLIWSASNHNFLCLPLILFVIHLALGDTWNTVFTVEGRLGFAVPVVIVGPWISVLAVTWSYWQTVPLAGVILFPSCIWLTIASILVYSIWKLNGQEAMYPLKIKSN